MNYDGWLPDDGYELAYDGFDGYGPFMEPQYNGYYDPWYYRQFPHRRIHPRHRRFRPHRRYW